LWQSRTPALEIAAGLIVGRELEGVAGLPIDHRFVAARKLLMRRTSFCAGCCLRAGSFDLLPME